MIQGELKKKFLKFFNLESYSPNKIFPAQGMIKIYHKEEKYEKYFNEIFFYQGHFNQSEIQNTDLTAFKQNI